MPDGALTVGDPLAMRDLARTLVGRAELLTAAGTGVTSKVAGAVFEGPAADRIRGATAEAQAQVTAAAGRLRDIASDLLADANEVERQNLALKVAAQQAAEAKAAEAKGQPAAVPTPGAGVTTTQAPAETPPPTPTPPAPEVSTGVTVSVDLGEGSA